MSEASPLIAVLDASVLYSAPLRHLLVALAIAGAFQARWSRTIQDEWTRSLLRDRPDLDAQRIARTRYLMDAHSPQSEAIPKDAEQGPCYKPPVTRPYHFAPCCELRRRSYS